MSADRAWYPSDAEWSCDKCAAAYPSPVHGATPYGGSLACVDRSCPTVEALRRRYPQPAEQGPGETA